MNKIIRILILSILLFECLSCKSQDKIYDNTNNSIEIIRDSIFCNGKIVNKYSVPFFNFINDESSDIVNDSISKMLNQYVFSDENENFILNNGLKIGLKKFVQYSTDNCCGTKCYSFNNCESEVYFYNNKIVSFGILIETYTAYNQVFSYFYNYDIENLVFLKSETIFIKEIEFLKFLERKVNSVNSEELEIDYFPETWFLDKRGSKKGMYFINSSPNLFYEIFLPLEELKPYLREDFKRQIDIE